MAAVGYEATRRACYVASVTQAIVNNLAPLLFIVFQTHYDLPVEMLGRRDLSGLITHELPLERFHDGLALLEGSKDCGKVMITMGAE